MSPEVSPEGIILAAGEGTRFYPLSKYLAKEFLPIPYYKDKENYHAKNNGTPFIVAIYDQIKDLTDSIYLVVNSLKQKSLDEIKKDYQIKAREVHKDLPLGDASALDGLLKEGKTYLIHYGDLIYNSPKFREDISEALNIIKNQEYGVVFLANKVFDEEEVKRFGVFKTEGNKIIEIYEKPKEKEILESLKKKDYWLVNSGIYVLKPNKELIEYIREETERAKNEFYNKGKFKEAVMTKILNNLIKKGFPAYAVEIKDHKNFMDLGTFKDWIKAWNKYFS